MHVILKNIKHYITVFVVKKVGALDGDSALKCVFGAFCHDYILLDQFVKKNGEMTQRYLKS